CALPGSAPSARPAGLAPPPFTNWLRHACGRTRGACLTPRAAPRSPDPGGAGLARHRAVPPGCAAQSIARLARDRRRGPDRPARYRYPAGPHRHDRGRLLVWLAVQAAGCTAAPPTDWSSRLTDARPASRRSICSSRVHKRSSPTSLTDVPASTSAASVQEWTCISAGKGKARRSIQHIAYAASSHQPYRAPGRRTVIQAMPVASGSSRVTRWCCQVTLLTISRAVTSADTLRRRVQASLPPLCATQRVTPMTATAAAPMTTLATVWVALPKRLGASSAMRLTRPSIDPLSQLA